MNSSFTGNSNSSITSDMHYDLPLDIEKISNFQDILSTFQLSEAAKNMLIKNGFAVIRHRTEQYDTEQYKLAYAYPSGIYEVYKNVRRYGIPMFVTCDSFDSNAFDSDDFVTDVAADTEARLGIFYVDLKYDSTNHVVNGIKEIPTVDASLLNDCIECLEKIVNSWN